MNKTKRNEYKLTASIHTLQIDTPDYIDLDQIPEGISEVAKFSNQKGSGTVVINPNKVDRDCFSFTEFSQKFNCIVDSVGLTDYRVKRCDLRLDTYTPGDYAKNAKFNKLLISLLAVTYSTKNSYRTVNLWSDNQISCSIKNSYFQVENYDRSYKNEITSNTIEIATSRLEERSMSRSMDNHDPSVKEQVSNIRKEFVEVWKRRWEKASGNFGKVCDRYNQELVRLWKEEKQKTEGIRFRSLSSFVCFHQNKIFCRRQLISLLMELGKTEQQAKDAADNWKKRYRFEWFSASDIRYGIKEIQRATEQFFAS